MSWFVDKLGAPASSPQASGANGKAAPVQAPKSAQAAPPPAGKAAPPPEPEPPKKKKGWF
jgi:hypothetical protein